METLKYRWTKSQEGGEEKRRKVWVQFSSLNLGLLNHTQLCSISLPDLQSMVICVCRPCVYMCLFAPMTPLALWAQLPSPQLSLIGLCAVTSASDWTTHARKLPGWVRQLKGTIADTSLLFWLLLTRVNCYHKAWRTALYVSVVMWACLAIRNMESSRFLTKLSVFFSNLLAIGPWTICHFINFHRFQKRWIKFGSVMNVWSEKVKECKGTYFSQ